MVSSRSSLVTAENGSDWVQDFLHCQLMGRGKSSPVSSTHCRWLYLLHIVHCGMLLDPFFIHLEHVSHLVFLAIGAQLVVLLLKKSRISLVSRDDSGKAEWWHWSHSQSTPRSFRSKY